MSKIQRPELNRTVRSNVQSVRTRRNLTRTIENNVLRPKKALAENTDPNP
jgi:hypothetical protein